MHKIEWQSPLDLSSFLEQAIRPHLNNLSSDNCESSQKKLELCHLGKLLGFLEGKLFIESVTEKPDFVISYEGKKVGVEHQIVVSDKDKAIEGFWKNTFILAQQGLVEEGYGNLLINCFLHRNLDYRIRKKNEYIFKIHQLIKTFIETGALIENNLIERVSSMKHSMLCLEPNLGGYGQKEISSKILLKAIEKKDKKLPIYLVKELNEVWLLLVIGSNGKSSYEVGGNFELQNFKSDFDRIYLLEDFNMRLFRLL